MLDHRLCDASDGVREALAELVPPPIEDLAGSSRKETPPLPGTWNTGSEGVFVGPLVNGQIDTDRGFSKMLAYKTCTKGNGGRISTAGGHFKRFKDGVF